MQVFFAAFVWGLLTSSSALLSGSRPGYSRDIVHPQYSRGERSAAINTKGIGECRGTESRLYMESEEADEGFEFVEASVGSNAGSVSKSEADEVKLPVTKEVAASIGALLGAFAFGINNLDPGVNGAELLRIAERESIPVAMAACQEKPIVIDFYAPWCENCKAVAPSLRQLEGAYGSDINFITVDGSDPVNEDLVGRFHVDGIPHLAFLDAKGTLQTSLIGAVPKPILKEELDALANAKPLPYRGAIGDGIETPIDLEKGVCALPKRYDNL